MTCCHINETLLTINYVHICESSNTCSNVYHHLQFADRLVVVIAECGAKWGIDCVIWGAEY